MAFWDAVQRHHVRQAVAEYDQLGQDEFLARYGFGRALAYLLIVDGHAYDSKAVLGVAYGRATGRPLGPKDFSGGAAGAAGVLRSLGFEVRNVRDPDR
jgi:5-methylcytosine-specific restriction enzyme A